ncbi:peptidoglycan hydrolase [Bacillaceae bacterium SIJ1]|uniref:glycosyl hydrolase family 18 protein n=1 Tax=Litoribacterium kuwaitense TaxID=1398745 RepID=UPI0013ED0124|nr:glycosyl hydrolase family 18 protein [Litoribacterium kuwaitense]NGP44021.1 peptidoglycan hydrolase [Litoribacterium kuwaitense]
MLFLLLTGGIFFVVIFPPASDEYIPYTSLAHPIVYEEELYSEEALWKEGELYIPLSFMKEVLQIPVIYDEPSEQVIFTTRSHVFKMPVSEAFYEQDLEKLILSVRRSFRNDMVYLAPNQWPPFLPYVFNTSEQKKAVHVYDNQAELTTAKVIVDDVDDRRLRERASLQEPYVKEVSQGEKVIVLQSEGDFTKVKAYTGEQGFIPSKALNTVETETLETSYEEVDRRPLPFDEPVNMTWEAVYSYNPDVSEISDMPGVQVVSPTWFALADNEGAISSKASAEYVAWAKERGYEVWALFSNDFDPDRTSSALATFERRQRMVDQVVSYVNEFQLDGINIDFENVYEEDGPFLTQFVRELTPALHKVDATVSLDMTFISSSQWSAFYERDDLSSIVDYMVVMAYDEHWGSSPKAGSVASLPWVESNLQRLLEVVPNDRLILGIPFYTRLWEEKTTEGENIEVSSSAYSMNGIDEWIAERNLTSTYDESTGQDYVEYETDGRRIKYGWRMLHQ